MAKLYYSLHGPDLETGEWSLMTYMQTPTLGRPGDTLTPNWLRPRSYRTFEEILQVLGELMDNEDELVVGATAGHTEDKEISDGQTPLHAQSKKVPL